ncbi:hypothetical protein OTU49_007560, partial [Cherax quadricarinatus]
MGTLIWKLYLIFSLLEIVNNLVGNADGQSHAFIQVDNELKYLVDGVAIHMNEGVVPVDLLPSLAHHCSHYLVTHEPSRLLDPHPSPCSDFRQHLDLRDCDSVQGGLLDPRSCLHLLDNTHYSALPPLSGSCTLDVCFNK